MTGEADAVRAAHFDDPFVDDATYGALVETAAAADEAASWADEDPARCPGHPPDEWHAMGETVYCDGTCQA